MHHLHHNLSKEKIKVLRCARDRIASGQNEALCIALDTAGEFDCQGQIYKAAAAELQTEIREAFRAAGISERSAVYVWLLKVGAIGPYEEVTDQDLLDYRLRWIDSWIADLENGAT